MDASAISTILPAFVIALIESADEADIRTPIGGTDGEDVAVLFRVGQIIGSVSNQGNLDWTDMGSAEEAAAQFAREREHTERLYAYIADPNHDPRVLVVVAQHQVSVDRAIQHVRAYDAMRAMAAQQEPASAPAGQAVGRAAVPQGTVYQAAGVEPPTGMYL